MDVLQLLEKYSLTDFPAAIGGCQNQGTAYECCEHDISVFDEKKEPDTIVEFDGVMACIHHCSFSETRSNVLAQFDGIKIVHDDQWELHMLLSRIREKRDAIFKDAARNSLVDSLFCITKSRQGLKISDPFSSCWIKCAAFYLADAILFYNGVRPSSAHLLHDIRALKDKSGVQFSLVNECIGTERATQVLLERMSKSTAGFSDMVEGNGHSKVIAQKSSYLVNNSLLSDCYFYLGYVNKNNIIQIKDTMAKRSDLIHVLKVALDIGSDPMAVERHADILYDQASDMLASM